MQIWKLEPVDGCSKPWDSGYDKAYGFVVLAETEEGARLLAANDAGDEGRDAWINSQLSTCKVVDTHPPARLLLRDFCAG